MEHKRILIIEDESNIASGIKLSLGLEGYDISIARDGLEGISLWKSSNPDLIILDLMLPKMNGYEVLQKIREKDEQIPILILSAKNTTEDKIKGLEFGVDDYLAKPFELDELILRVKRLMKQSSWYSKSVISDDTTVIFGKNTVSLHELKAKTARGEIQLTAQEAKLLKVMFDNPGEILSREILLRDAWNYDQKTNTRTVDNFIARFRKYFEDDPKSPKHFTSKRSQGYIFNC